METVTCPKCSAKIARPEAKPPLLNHPEKCVIVLDTPHISCPNPLCGAQFFCVISGYQFGLQMVPAPPATPEKRIVVPNLLMPKNPKR